MDIIAIFKGFILCTDLSSRLKGLIGFLNPLASSRISFDKLVSDILGRNRKRLTYYCDVGNFKAIKLEVNVGIRLLSVTVNVNGVLHDLCINDLIASGSPLGNLLVLVDLLLVLAEDRGYLNGANDSLLGLCDSVESISVVDGENRDELVIKNKCGNVKLTVELAIEAFALLYEPCASENANTGKCSVVSNILKLDKSSLASVCQERDLLTVDDYGVLVLENSLYVNGVFVK